MRQAHFTHEVVEFIPEKLDDGKLYVSYKYGTAVHKCACGCGEEVVTPLNPTDWSVRIDVSGATLRPSIGNWSFACQSHYFIRGGRVVWAGRMTKQQIERGRAHDREVKDVYFAEVNHAKSLPSPSLIRTIWNAMKRWWNA